MQINFITKLFVQEYIISMGKFLMAIKDRHIVTSEEYKLLREEHKILNRFKNKLQMINKTFWK